MLKLCTCSDLLFSLQFEVTCIESNSADFGELWLHPGTAMLCMGPYVDIPGLQFYSASGFGTNSATNNKHPFLSLQTYSDSNALISYLTQTLSTQDILTGIHWSHRLTREQVSNENALFALSFLPATVYSKLHLGIIAQWPGDMREWYYEQWHVGGLLDKMQESQVDMDDGSVRITMMLSDIQYLQGQEIGFQYGLHPIDEFTNFLNS
uniref:Uncharacterized protein n=1 Tax=Moniliophthora roreri TaxID=221103 RepID=A0A0W0FA51_MONRR